MDLPAHSRPRSLIQFRNHFSQTVWLLGRVISPLQGRYLNTGQHKHRINARTHTPNIHASSGIRTHDPSVRVSEDSSCHRPRGYCDRLLWAYRTSIRKYNVARRTSYGIICIRYQPLSVSFKMQYNECFTWTQVSCLLPYLFMSSFLSTFLPILIYLPDHLSVHVSISLSQFSETIQWKYSTSL
jgi:hypothetical protein